MAEKKTQLSIILRAVDRATAVVKGVSDQLNRVTKPVRNLKDALADLRESSGLDDVSAGFKGVGSAIAGVLSKVAVVGGLIAAATAGVFHLIDGFDELGDKAEEAGVSVEFLASMRYAAERSGASIEQLDSGLKSFSTSMGMARAGTGKMAAFLSKVNPEFLVMLKATKSNEEAFDLIARGAANIVDPAKRAAFAARTLGDASLAPLLNKGADGIEELRKRYLKLNPDVGEAAARAGEVDDAMKDLKATTDGVKSSLVVGLAPALKVIVERLREWLDGHREDIKQWAIELGQRLPGAVSKLAEFVRDAVRWLRDFFDAGWKVKAALVALAGVIVGPVISAVVSLGAALLTTPIGWVIAGIAAISGAALLIYKNWDAIAGFFGDLWDGVTEIFQAAWDRIKAIVDHVVSAVDTVIGAAGKIADYLGDIGGVGSVRDLVKQQGAPSSADVFRQAAAISAVRTTSDAKVTIDINGPAGTRAKLAPQSTANVDLSMALQMGGS